VKKQRKKRMGRESSKTPMEKIV